MTIDGAKTRRTLATGGSARARGLGPRLSDLA
jgi:hypothetical protein